MKKMIVNTDVLVEKIKEETGLIRLHQPFANQERLELRQGSLLFRGGRGVGFRELPEKFLRSVNTLT